MPQDKPSAAEALAEMDRERSKFSAVSAIVLFDDGHWVAISADDPERQANLEREMRGGGQVIGFIGLVAEPEMSQVWPASAHADTKERSDVATKQLVSILAMLEKRHSLTRVAQYRSREEAN